MGEDVLNYGLSPIERLMAEPVDEHLGQYRVIEGNRRVAAMKMIASPTLAAGTKLEAAFNKLHARKHELPEEIDFVVLTKHEGYLWIQRKHNTGLDGVGPDPWTAIMQERAAADLGDSSAVNNVIESVMKYGGLHEDVKERVRGAGFKVTNLRRLLRSSGVRETLGLKVEGNTVYAACNPAWTLSALTKIVDVIAKGSWQGKPFTSRTINTANEQQYFVDQVAKTITTPKLQQEPWVLSPESDLSASLATTIPNKRLRLNPRSSDRKRLVPPSCKAKPSIGRANDIYLELRNRLIIDKTPNAVAILFRVFLEFSIEDYISRNNIANVKSEDVLYKKINAVVSFMIDKKVFSDKKLNPVKQMVSQPEGLVSTMTLNAYVHSAGQFPSEKELKISWDRIQFFIEELWRL